MQKLKGQPMKPELEIECKYCVHEKDKSCGPAANVCFGFCPRADVLDKLHDRLDEERVCPACGSSLSDSGACDDVGGHNCMYLGESASD